MHQKTVGILGKYYIAGAPCSYLVVVVVAWEDCEKWHKSCLKINLHICSTHGTTITIIVAEVSPLASIMSLIG